ncbi:hypothetical protein KDAU_74210 [Dictyobacter aurantiacus]|uniref:HTH cro/C1-type domain-containing protein n=1 Tax=Dictyobacter aurantiacus TaxID=1936993 RepID=A0A401ZTG3_9CHLR|nr:hypothetical protein KDAU_74210 [Dictyobacter aurantiacus]
MHGEPDYVFGQRMLTLRIAIGLTQESLAELLSISRKTIGRWEAGEAYPKPSHLQALLALALKHRVFAVGQEEEEIRVLWRAAHQRVLLDESWLRQQLIQESAYLTDVEQSSAPDVTFEPQLDWGEALDVPSFYGREEELDLLSRWIVEDRCRVISVLGMGGIGKSALSIMVMHQVARQFEVVIWRSLRDSPSCAALIKGYLQVLDPQAPAIAEADLPDLLQRLLEQLRTRRVLLVLDNLETLLEQGTTPGRLRTEAQDYGPFLRYLVETSHQSCLLLTSREKLADFVPWEGKRSPVRILRLSGLDKSAGAQLLEEKEVVGSSQDLARLIEVYQGNPLALKTVGRTIVDLFGGQILPFLEQGNVVFGGVRELLDEQYSRLSRLEQIVFCWLAILREPVRLPDLLAVLSPARVAAQVLEALDGLSRRSIVERGQQSGSFTLQSVVLEYATDRLIEWATSEIEQGRLACLLEYGLCRAQAKEYVRAIQERLFVVPLLSRLQSTYLRQADLEERLYSLLDDLRKWDQQAQGYGPANLVVLLRVLRGDLRGLDLSDLFLRGVFLQGIDMRGSTLAHSTLLDSVFTQRLDNILTVVVSSDGVYWATANDHGEICVWDGREWFLRQSWHAHTDIVWHLSFSPDGRTLVSGGVKGFIRLWDVTRGTLLWENWQPISLTWLAFSPDGDLLASSGHDAVIRLWEPRRGTLLRTLSHSHSIITVAWSPNKKWLTCGCSDGSIGIWELEGPEPDSCIRVMMGHTHWVTGLAFSPNGEQLASASYDGTIKLWDLTTGNCLQTFAEHPVGVTRVSWSADGNTLASCSSDHTIRFWNLKEGRSRMVLQGHTDNVNNLAFTPDSRILLSGSSDGTLRVWEVERGACLRILGGYLSSLLDIDWRPDSAELASCGADSQLKLWDVASGTVLKTFRGHQDWEQVAWRPDGQILSSVGRDNIGLWDLKTDDLVQMLQGPNAHNTLFQSIAWSPDGHLLACGSYLQGVQVWEMPARRLRWVGETLPMRIGRVVWSPDGTRLAACGNNGYVYIWDAKEGTLLHKIAGHQGVIIDIAWSPDGMMLASVGSGRGAGEIFIWHAQSGQCIRSWLEHSGIISAVVWSPSGQQLISGGSDGKLRWWQVEDGQCVRVREGHLESLQSLKVSPDGRTLASCGDDGAIMLWNVQSGELLQTLRQDRPYEGLNITGIQGLSAAQKASLRMVGAFEEMPLLE